MLLSLKLSLKAVGNAEYQYFSGVFTYAAVLTGIKQIDPSLASELHELDGLKAFTVSALLTSDFKYVNKVTAGSLYEILVTFLDDKVFNAFYRYINDCCISKKAEILKNYIQVGHAAFEVLKLDVGRVTQWDELLENSNLKTRFELNFYTPTSFRSAGRNYIFPDSSKVIRSLSDKWNNQVPQLLIIEKEQIVKLEEVLYAIKHEVYSTMITTKNYMINGFLGQCTYEIAKEADDKQKTLINALIRFGLFSGIGYKTTMGMGRYWLK